MSGNEGFSHQEVGVIGIGGLVDLGRIVRRVEPYPGLFLLYLEGRRVYQERENPT